MSLWKLEIWNVHVYNTEGDCVIFNRSLVATHDMRENFFFFFNF